MSGQRTRMRGVLFMLLSLAIGVFSYVFGVQSAVGQQAEASVLNAAAFTTNPPPPLNLVSIPSVMLVLLLSGGLALAVHGVRRACAVTFIPAIAIIASQLLKQQFLQRPGLFELDAPNTFPSGHMTVFVAVVAAIVWAVPSKARAITAFLGAILLSIVAWQLLAYGWHRPSDVLGALALGVFVFAAISMFFPGRRATRATLGRVVGVTLTMSGLILVAAGLVVAVLAVATSRDGFVLLAGELGVIGAACLSARAFLSLSSR